MTRYLLSAEPGLRFGRWSVIGETQPGEYRAALCRCDCGTERTVVLRSLHRGLSRSCGCLKRERATAHGLASHPLYHAWHAMLARCENPHHRAYPRYGGRGIRVCDRWHDVRLFVADIERLLGPRPDGMSLDRIDNERGYEPDNVQWATPVQQQQNRHATRLTATVVMVCRARRAAGEALTALAAEFGVNRVTLASAISGQSWAWLASEEPPR